MSTGNPTREELVDIVDRFIDARCDRLLYFADVMESLLQSLEKEVHETRDKLLDETAGAADYPRTLALLNKTLEESSDQRAPLYHGFALLLLSSFMDTLATLAQLGGRVSKDQTDEWRLEHHELYYRLAGSWPKHLSEWQTIMRLKKICNRIKHQGARADKKIVEWGYATRPGLKITLTSTDAATFLEACRAFLHAVAKDASFGSPGTWPFDEKKD